MYDLNMKEIKFPEGLMPLDIFVGSIAKERATETIEGRSGIVDYGTNYVDRSVELSMWINSSDTTDYRLLRNELYALFDTGNAFYIEETRVPSRVLKVAVDESFIPDRLTIRNASVDVTCRTLDSVFWESKYTTLELHDSGYSATAEKYGLVDNIDDEKVQYRFTSNNFTVYNAGNVTVEPESMDINIIIEGCNGNKITIHNKTTGDKLEISVLMSGHLVTQRGMVVTVGGVNRFRDTNRRFISLAPGDNVFEISGATFERASIDFKYYYK